MKKVKKMVVRKNYRNVWLKEERMEQQFPELVKHYNGLGWGEEDETQLNSYGFEFKKIKKFLFILLMVMLLRLLIVVLKL